MTYVTGDGDPAAPRPAAPTPLTPPSAWLTLFNEDRFHALNVGDGQRPLLLPAHDADGRVIGALGGVLDGTTFLSGFSAPYGGVDLVRDRETPANVAHLVDDALGQLRAVGARTVRLRMPPPALGECEGLITFTLLNHGFRVERCDLNQHLDLGALADADAYVAALRSPARRALRHALGAGDLRLAEAVTPGEWDRAHALLVANRAAKGRRFALSRAYVERARAALGGDTVRLLRLVDAGDQLVAAALVYRVRAGRDLVVAWGDDPDHGRDRSPMNLLAYRVVEDALARGVRTLDLGISNEPQPDPAGGGLQANAGLVQFKQSVLARSEPRLTLVKEL